MGMGKKKTSTAAWMVFMQGTLLSAGCYLAGILLLALLVVKGTVPERAVFPATAVLCFLASAGGGVLTVRRRPPWGPLPSALLNAGLFTALLLLLGLSCWQRITWNGHGGVLMLCALAGGVLAGFLGGHRSRRRRKRK